MASDEELLRIAVEEAKIGIRAGHGGPFGCVIAKNGVVHGKGHNRVLIDNDPTAHGEITAIRNTCRELKTIDLSDFTLYTSSEPCPMCKAAISWAKVGRVVYAASMEEANEILGFKDLRMSNAMKNGEDLTPSERIHVEGYLEPFEEYRDMQGTIY
ncbi:MAG: nucleoside deaminase [Candidatus Methanomethylophilaceae archaeon]|nr:nucleoside deaminase [Candidatus Methanomethylophilaceae archaeon]MBR4686149.1 nucleoside deaminase [Candidatus Methanomethylophilaceae archaeon]